MDFISRLIKRFKRKSRKYEGYDLTDWLVLRRIIVDKSSYEDYIKAKQAFYLKMNRVG